MVAFCPDSVRILSGLAGICPVTVRLLSTLGPLVRRRKFGPTLPGILANDGSFNFVFISFPPSYYASIHTTGPWKSAARVITCDSLPYNTRETPRATTRRTGFGCKPNRQKHFRLSSRGVPRMKFFPPHDVAVHGGNEPSPA